LLVFGLSFVASNLPIDCQELGERVGRELGLAVYLYEAAQDREERRNLSVIREGEYEGIDDEGESV
jgi:glutamate formiminotransferase